MAIDAAMMDTYKLTFNDGWASFFEAKDKAESIRKAESEAKRLGYRVSQIRKIEKEQA